MRTNLKTVLATLTVLLLALGFLGFSVPISSASATHASSSFNFNSVSTNCAFPTFQTYQKPALNSTFTLTVIAASGASITFNQASILNLPSCVAYGGFVAHGSGEYLPDDYGNYTGVPVSYLAQLTGGMIPGQNVIATSGTDLYQTTYNYSEVMQGTGWGYIFNTATCSTPNVCDTTSAAVGTSPPIPMYLVVAYLWNGSNIGAYSCIGVPTPCPHGPTSSGDGPLRTVTLGASPGYLIQYGAPWNKAAAIIQVTPFTNYQACPSVPNSGGANLRGADLEYCNLASYNLAGDNLQGANMQYTNLTGANLQGANLIGADLANSIAQGANFQHANMLFASLEDTVLTGDNFMGANLLGANLAFAYAPNTNFTGDNLFAANLFSGIFNYANFEWTNLIFSNLSYGQFEYANFTGANAWFANLQGANFTGAINPP